MSTPSPAGPPEPGTPERNWFEPARPPAVHEPTQVLPVVAPRKPRRPPPVKAAARAVIVYQERPRRPWLLWAFTSVLVALTVGVILGQTVAFEPTYRSSANAQTAAPAPSPSPSASSLSASTPALRNGPWPDAQHHVTAPLGTARTRLLEVTGASTTLHIRAVDLGDTMLDVATTDRSAVPRLTGTGAGSRLELIQTGDPGTVGAEIQLNTKVTWTIRLTGGTTAQTVDMTAGRVAGIQLGGGTADVVLQLPPPKGTVPVSLTGPVGRLTVRTKTATAMRLRLGAGAGTAVLDGKTHRQVKPGTALTTTTWRTATNRYDLTASDAITSVLTATA